MSGVTVVQERVEGALAVVSSLAREDLKQFGVSFPTSTSTLCVYKTLICECKLLNVLFKYIYYLDMESIQLSSSDLRVTSENLCIQFS